MNETSPKSAANDSPVANDRPAVKTQYYIVSYSNCGRTYFVTSSRYGNAMKEDAQKFLRLLDAASACTRYVALEKTRCCFKIILVEETRTRGIRIPGSTKRRMVRPLSEPMPANTLIALANPFSDLNNKDDRISFYDGATGFSGKLNTTPLFKSHSDAIRAMITAPAVARGVLGTVGGNLVRVVEEVIPEAFAPDVVTVKETVLV